MKNRLNIVVIDDEIDAVELIESTISEQPDKYNVVASTTNPMTGIKLILEHKPDVVLLDIEMPQMNGFKLLEILGNFSFQLIFVTAYENHAIKAFKNNALDYILKPVSGVELFNALEKAKNIVSEKAIINKNTEKPKSNTTRMVVPTLTGYEFINIEDIIRLEADSSYTKILISNKMVLVSKTLREFEFIIDFGYFFRAHRSHIINIQKIVKFDKGSSSLKMYDEAEIPISRSNLSKFRDLLSSNFIHIGD